MRGSDPGGLTSPGGPPTEAALAAEMTRSRPLLQERIFRAPLWVQVRESAWLFTVAVLLPAVAIAAALVIEGVVGRRGLVWVVLMLVGGFGHVMVVAARAAGGKPRRFGRCAWVALGEGYIRLGMSFLRPTISFAQIAGVERGALLRGKWAGGGAGPRVGVRFVLPPTWDVAFVTYPASMDPLGELTTALQSAASRSRDKLRLREEASDEEVAQACRNLTARFQARSGTPG